MFQRLKRFSRRCAIEAMRRVPKSLRADVIKSWSDTNIDFQTFGSFARRFNVESLGIYGSLGTFRGSPDDQSVLGSYARDGIWGANTIRLIQQYFLEHGSGTYIDIGANIGFVTVPIARDERISCIAIEPEPTNFSFLVENIRRNGMSRNVSTHQIAMFDRKSTLSFELSTGNFGDHRIRLQTQEGSLNEQSRATIEVRGDLLDDIIASVELPLVVKIDTQGAEPFVVSGGSRILSQAGLIIMEFWPYGMKRLRGDADIIFAYLREYFERAALYFENGELLLEASIDDVIFELRDMLHESSNDPSIYVDIVAHRTSNVV